MAGLMKSLSSLPVFNVMDRASYGLPALPEDLGLPPLPDRVGQGFNQGKNSKDTDPTVISKQIEDADKYNKAFVELLNQQPQLSGSERQEIYGAYSVKSKDTHKGPGPSDFTGLLSQAGAMTKEQIAAQQQPQAAATPAPAAAAPTPTPAPQTVGPVPQPTTTVQPAATPTVATPAGNIAGKTTTTGVMGVDAGGRGSGRKRGRVATLLTGLGGSVEQFGA